MIHIVVEGPPPRKNERHKVIRIGSRGALKNGEKYDSFCVRLLAAWAKLGLPMIAAGRWSMKVDAYWDRMMRKRRGKPITGGPFPAGDFDAPLSSVADALMVIGALDDDLRILGGTPWKHYDKARPRVEITLTEILDG